MIQKKGKRKNQNKNKQSIDDTNQCKEKERKNERIKIWS